MLNQTQRQTQGHYSILMVDDHEDFAQSLLRLLEPQFPDVDFVYASSEEQARQCVFAKSPDIVLLDLEIDPLFGTQSGLTFLSWIRAHVPDVDVLVLTSNHSAENGMEALARGARSFLAKPPRMGVLQALLEDALQLRHIKKRTHGTSFSSSRAPEEIPGLVGSSLSFQRLLADIHLASSCNLHVLLLGESGVGKSQIAEIIHRRSDRAGSSFLRAHAILGNSELAQSELFGHRKGAFTGAVEARKGIFERVGSGTVFLDECAEFPLNIQVLLLDVLQTGRFSPLGCSDEKTSLARIIAATNASLSERLEQGQFRYDLFYRLSSLVIHVPSLRERLDDLPALARHFLQYNSRGEFSGFSLSEELLQNWTGLPWKGNIRELEHRVLAAAHRARLRNSLTISTHDDIPFSQTAPLQPSGALSLNVHNQSPSFHARVQAFKIELIQQALLQARGNQSQAAAALGLDRSTLRRILAEGCHAPKNSSLT